MVLRISRIRWFGHVERSSGWIAEVRKLNGFLVWFDAERPSKQFFSHVGTEPPRPHKLNVVAQKRSARPRKSWDEVIENDRKKLDMDSTNSQNCSEWRGHLRERLVKSRTLGRGKRALKWI